MNLLKYISKWLQSLPAFKFLFLLGLFLLANAFLSQQILIHSNTNHQSAQTKQLMDYIATNANQQLLPLVANNQLENAANQLNKLTDYDLLQQVALYQSNGSLVQNSKNYSNLAKNLQIKVEHLTDKNIHYGYLVFGFHKNRTSNKNQNHWLYFIALGLWLFATLILLLSSKTKKNQSIALTKPTPLISYKKELQQLLKRSKDQGSAKQLLIINADWDTYDKQPRQPLISLLNKWTAHHKCHLISFEQNLLIIGLPEIAKLETFEKIHILEVCLKELGLEPTFLIHKLEFGKEIYQHFFGVVEQGIWLESQEDLALDNKGISIKQNIEIEVETYGLVNLLLIDALKAESTTYIERQSRFFLQ